MAVVDIVPVPGESFEQTMLSASPDVLREMVRGFAQKMMDAEVEVACGAGYGEVSPNRVNSRNGYRHRKWDTRAGNSKRLWPAAFPQPQGCRNDEHRVCQAKHARCPQARDWMDA